jgi:radical SAM superfamily enzyme YgiQ (UPF0313 family)
MSWKLKEKARSLLKQEEGTITKPWGGKLSVALVYPNAYHVGMSNLGFQSVYRAVNELPFAVCERVFLPDKADLKEWQRSPTPLFSLESQSSLHDFDLVAFSVSFENDYPHILTLLELSRIPLRTSRRKEGYPLVFAGGISVFLNPEPLAEFMDFFVLGEAEEVLPQCLSALLETTRQETSRTQRLTRLAAIEGVYVPEFYSVTYHDNGHIASFLPRKDVPATIRRRWIKQVDAYPTASCLHAPAMEFAGMHLVEIGRGCSFGCRFCASGWVYRPVRMRSISGLRHSIQRGLAEGKKIGLISAALGDHPQISELCRLITAPGGTLSVSSLRARDLPQELLDALKQSGHQSVTLAPETGTERLRQVINKRLSDEDICETAVRVVRSGIPNLRLYFLVGLPTETMEDIEAIVALTKRIKHQLLKSLERKSLPGTITLSVTPFVPKPFTPFQWVAFTDQKVLEERIKHIQRSLKKEQQVVVTADLPKWSYVQALLSRGDRRVSKILLQVHQNDGDWNQAFRESDINPDFFVYRQRELTEILPWDFIDSGTKKETLVSEYHQALTVG